MNITAYPEDDRYQDQSFNEEEQDHEDRDTFKPFDYLVVQYFNSNLFSQIENHEQSKDGYCR